ncbi:hypothetical protein FE257_010826 [Aspergillus nanangensis]|uniref:Uncharacterized protein n=1 Tax=Aspergillus nanangensis TaxID=2582783 RepID=A0AAD4CVK2_ASPNN|nr:hypothetical protein FE257_010826 [Aspergillus nanangensis]
MAPTRDQLLSTAHAFLASLPEHYRLLSPNVTVKMGPDSLGIPDKKGREELREFVAPLAASLKNLKVWVKEGTEPIIDTQARKVVIQAKSYAETVIGEYANEFVFILTTNESGDLLDEYVELVDSNYAKNFFERPQAANW